MHRENVLQYFLTRHAIINKKETKQMLKASNQYVRIVKVVLCCLSVFASVTHALSANYNTSIIKGSVVDADQQTALSYVNVALMETGNRQPLNTTFTDEKGTFILTGLPQKLYILVFTYVGYTTKTVELPLFSSATFNLGQIALTSAVTQLQEVSVVTERPLVEHDVNKLIYHVEMDPESHTLSALEMLRKVPLLSIDGDDNLQLSGSDSYQVLINGKTSSLFVQNPGEVFKSMPASSIKSIEVITNPPARYDAEGVSGIINVITHRKTISGYNGSVTLSLSSPRAATLGGYLTAKAGKFGFSGHFGSNTYTSPAARSHFLRKDNVRQSTLEQRGESNSHNSSRNVSGELSYELSSQGLLTGSYRLNSNQGGSNFHQQVELFDPTGALAQAYRNLSTGRNKSGGSDASLNYQHSFSKRPEQLFMLSYKVSKNVNTSYLDFGLQPLLNYTGQVSQTQNEGGTMEHTLQADYLQPINKQTLELGLKSILRHNSSDYFYRNQDLETGTFMLNPRQSNNFDYRQDIHAAYASLGLKKGKWGLQAGARLEDTEVNANFRSSVNIAKQHYLNLIPNLNLSHRLKGSSTVRLSYTQRLERPGLYHLNPYVDLTDPGNISYGNPELEPATNHVFNVAYNTYGKGVSINTSFFYYFTNNSIQHFTTLGADTVARTTYANIGRRQSYGFILSGSSTLFKKLILSLNTTFHYIHLSTTFQGQLQNNAGLTLNASGNASYRFAKTWRASGNMGYNSPQILMQGKSSGFISSSLSVNKEILKNNKGSLSLMVRNPFQQHRRFLSEVNDPGFHQLQESFSVIRQYSLAFSYRFGKVQTSIPRRIRSIQKEDLHSVD
jgi:outer membrane receptor protein involved in Fe transport